MVKPANMGKSRRFSSYNQKLFAGANNVLQDSNQPTW